MVAIPWGAPGSNISRASLPELPVIYWQHDDVMGVWASGSGFDDFFDSVPSLVIAMDFEYGSGCYELIEITSQEQYDDLLASGVFRRVPF